MMLSDDSSSSSSSRKLPSPSTPGNSAHEYSNAQVFYEQLGAPTILYRHKPSYSPFEYSDDGLGGEHGSVYAPDLVDTFHSHQPWKKPINDLSQGPEGQAKKYAKYILQCNLDADGERRLQLQMPYNGARGTVESGLKDVSQPEEGRSEVLWRDRSRYQYIEVPEIQNGCGCSTEKSQGVDNLFHMSHQQIREKIKGTIQRIHASPRDGYGTPFRLQDIEYGLDAIGPQSGSTKTSKVKKNRLKMEENPTYYGNCLKLLPCDCEHCVNHSTITEDSSNERREMKNGNNAIDDENDSDDASQQSRELLPNPHRYPASQEDIRQQRSSTHPFPCRRYFLLHPKGQSIAISSIQLPLMSPQPTRTRAQTPDDDQNNQQEITTYARTNTEVDVGRILQVGLCTNANELTSASSDTADIYNTGSNRKKGMICVVRTPNHCSIISCESSSRPVDRNEKGPRTKSGSDSGSDPVIDEYIPTTASQCNGGYELKEVAKIYLEDDTSNKSIQGSTSSSSVLKPTMAQYDPIHVATNQHDTAYGGNLEAMFAILSRRRESGLYSLFGEEGPDTIHLAKVHDMQYVSVRRHSIQGLSSISRIEFSSMHSLVLWAAAREKIQNETSVPSGRRFYHSFHFQKRPVMGYGHSLHSIDLRSNRHSFVWSPSHDEFTPRSIHSINDILVDDYRPHSLFTSCTSAAKLYHVDARMPARTISSWTLPGLCDDIQVMNPPGGIYGNGMLLSRPDNVLMLEPRPTSPPIIGLNQDPGSCGFHLYQEAVNFGRFQTRNLERIAHPGLDPTGANATSSYFALPDVSESHFATGLAAFETPLSSILNIERENFQKALCVVTSTSRGDIYSHTLLPSEMKSEGTARCVRGGGVGSCAVPVPFNGDPNQPMVCKDKDSNLHWTVNNTTALISNSFITGNDPIPSSQLGTIGASETRQEEKRRSTAKIITSKHGRPDEEIGIAQKACHPRTTLNGILPRKRRVIRSRKPMKRYAVKKPSENLQQIIGKLRAKNHSTVSSWA